MTEREAKERILDVLAELGHTDTETTFATIAKALESLLMLTDLQGEMVEELTNQIIEERRLEDYHYEQLNDYSKALERQIERLSRTQCECGDTVIRLEYEGDK